MAINPNKLFIRVGAGSITNGKLTVKDILDKSAEAANNSKVFFIADTNQIVVGGVAYGLSADTATEIDKIKSILKTYFADGTEDNVKAAIDAVKAELDAYKTTIESKAFGGVTYADKKIKFTAVDGTAIGEIAASDIVGEHVVNGSSYDADKNELTIKFADGKGGDVPVTIDLGQMLDMNDVISGDTAHFTANYTEKKLTLTPVVGALAGDTATAGLADATEARAYVDAAINAANAALNEYKTATDARLNVLESDGDGSVAKALADAKAYTDEQVTAEADRAKGVENGLNRIMNNIITGMKRVDTDVKTNAADITAINTALESADTFWENYDNLA